VSALAAAEITVDRSRGRRYRLKGRLGLPRRQGGHGPACRKEETTPQRRPPLVTIAGLTAIIVCVALAAAAYAYYPRAFSPAANWISDLGNTLLSPRGSIWFRADMVAVGLVLAAFFVGLVAWHRGQRPIFRAFLALGQLSGLVAAVALVMTGIYSENDRATHAIWVTVLFIALASAVWFIGWAPVWYRRLPRKIPYVALVAGAADLISVIGHRHWMEWLAVALLLCFVGAVSLGTWSMAPVRVSNDR
jgi:hypothetical membrane protein